MLVVAACWRRGCVYGVLMACRQYSRIRGASSGTRSRSRNEVLYDEGWTAPISGSSNVYVSRHPQTVSHWKELPRAKQKGRIPQCVIGFFFCTTTDITWDLLLWLWLLLLPSYAADISPSRSKHQHLSSDFLMLVQFSLVPLLLPLLP